MKQIISIAYLYQIKTKIIFILKIIIKKKNNNFNKKKLYNKLLLLVGILIYNKYNKQFNQQIKRI